MEDPESQDTTPILNPAPVGSVVIFGRSCKLTQDKLTLRELHRLSASVLTTVAVGATAICFQREPVVDDTWINIRWWPIVATYATALMYILDFANIYTGGWGASDGRFWCDVKIMYVRGFNTMRTVCRFFSVSAMFTMLACLLGAKSSVAFIIMLVVVSEWQAGLAENQNQYDIKFQDKFLDDENHLCIETLHQYQLTHAVEHVVWTSFAIASTVKLLTLTCMFITATRTSTLVFAGPVIVGGIVWSYVLSTTLDFAYFKHAITFCQLEIYRMLADVAALTIVVMFTLV